LADGGSFFYLWRKTHADDFSCLSTDFSLVTLMIFAAMTRRGRTLSRSDKGPGKWNRVACELSIHVLQQVQQVRKSSVATTHSREQRHSWWPRD
jgi:hypothetical protein